VNIINNLNLYLHGNEDDGDCHDDEQAQYNLTL